MKKKSKRVRSPDSSYLPNQPIAKKLRANDGQEKISAALNPDTISKKKTVLAEKKQIKEKLPDELQERITMRIFDYIVADARPISTVESTYFRNMLKEIDPRVNIPAKKELQFNCSLTIVSITRVIWPQNYSFLVQITVVFLQ
jgi:hypothetical protein